jgi:hypothetical protein
LRKTGISRQDLAHLEAAPHLSADKLAEVLETVEAYLSNVTDQFREERRLVLGSSYFLFDLTFRDGGYGHRLLFYVNDSHAAAGVLVVEFVDHELGGPCD